MRPAIGGSLRLRLFKKTGLMVAEAAAIEFLICPYLFASIDDFLG